MKPKENFEQRTQMAEMHDDVLKRIDNAIKKKHSIEACWLCYSCFESRITRTLEKASENCAEKKCFQNPKVGIKTRIDCLKRLKKLSYAGVECFDSQLLGQVYSWCKERNGLVHALVTLNNYYGMDEKFLALARQGKTLVEKLYAQTTSFRNNYYQLNQMPDFPSEAHDKCRLLKKDKEETDNGKS